jgi:hypothetical protein
MIENSLPPETVFLSYAHQDVDRIDSIIKALQSFEWTASVDRLVLLSGDDWEKKIPRLIENAYAVVVLWSRHSVESEWVRKEAALGLAKPSKSKRLFPVLLERGIQPPSEFAALHAVDLSNWTGSPHDPMFRNLVVGVENAWTLDSGMALRKDITTMPTIRVVKRAAPAAVA